MDFQSFEPKLVNHRIFRDIRDSLGDKRSAKLGNLLEIKDDVLYVWNSVEICLYSVNLKRLEEDVEETPYQKLQLVTPPAFAVERIVSSQCGSRLCLWGSRGVVVLDLPSRWGRSDLFEAGNKTILCKSSSVDERFLFSDGEIRKVHWHPKSLSHILVLVSDNTMRLYNIALKTGTKLVKIFTVGPKPLGALGQTVMDSLGDTAIDFTTTPDNECLLILSGNGDVHVMQIHSDVDSKTGVTARLYGPLAMLPSSEDNYGSESCAITALGAPNAPMVVVIASTAAVLYHCVLLPNSADRGDDGYLMYVVESVELNIAQSSDAPNNSVYPVHLYPSGRGSYICVHVGGAHSVLLPITAALKEYALARNDEIESLLKSITSKPSSARHLMCGSYPPLGVAITQPPVETIIIMCQGGDVLTRTIAPCGLEEYLYKEVQLRNPSDESEELKLILKKEQKTSITRIVHEVIQRRSSQPILRLHGTTRAQICLELVILSTVRLRSQYIEKQRRARDIIRIKKNAILALSKQQSQWLRDLKNEIEDIQTNSAELNEKRAIAETNQEIIKFRISMISRALRAGSCQTEDDWRQLAELESAKARTNELQEQLGHTKRILQGRRQQVKNWEQESKKKNIVLGKSHSENISSILQQQTMQISAIIEETKFLKDQLGII